MVYKPSTVPPKAAEKVSKLLIRGLDFLVSASGIDYDFVISKDLSGTTEADNRRKSD